MCLGGGLSFIPYPITFDYSFRCRRLDGTTASRGNFIFQNDEIGYTRHVAELIFNIDVFALKVD